MADRSGARRVRFARLLAECRRLEQREGIDVDPGRGPGAGTGTQGRTRSGPRPSADASRPGRPSGRRSAISVVALSSTRTRSTLLVPR